MKLKVKCVGISDCSYSDDVNYNFKADNLCITNGQLADEVSMTFTVTAKPDLYVYGETYEFYLLQD